MCALVCCISVECVHMGLSVYVCIFLCVSVCCFVFRRCVVNRELLRCSSGCGGVWRGVEVV